MSFRHLWLGHTQMSPSIPFADSNNPAVCWPISTEHANSPAAAAEEQECKVSMERAGMATTLHKNLMSTSNHGVRNRKSRYRTVLPLRHESATMRILSADVPYSLKRQERNRRHSCEVLWYQKI